MFNLLIRNKYRPELFRRCITSIVNQTYKSVRVIVACDSYESHNDALRVLVDGELDYEIFMVQTPKTDSAYWNLYCNELKERVKSGYFFFYDNDETLASPTVLQELSEHLEPGKGIICQFLRNGKPKPNDKLIELRQIIKGRCGGGCLVLPAEYKHVADWRGIPGGDYYWINEIQKQVPLKFIKLVVQHTDRKLNGK